MYSRVSFIQPMFHLSEKPRPPTYVGRETPVQAVDSSAIVRTPGYCRWISSLNFLEKLSASDILPPAEAVRPPLAFLAAVVEVEHRGDGISPQAVDVVLVEPEQ